MPTHDPGSLGPPAAPVPPDDPGSLGPPEAPVPAEFPAFLAERETETVRRGLGTLRIRRYPAHRVRHPSTGMHVLVPTRVRPQFRVAEGLRKRLNDECGSA